MAQQQVSMPQQMPQRRRRRRSFCMAAQAPAAVEPAAVPAADVSAAADERTEATHFGWKVWSDSIVEPGLPTTSFAICSPTDGVVYTSVSVGNGDAPLTTTRRSAFTHPERSIGPHGITPAHAEAHSTGWAASFPLFQPSSDAQAILRKIRAETFWRGGIYQQKYQAAEHRLAWAKAFNERLSKESPLGLLPWDLLDKVQRCAAEDSGGCSPPGCQQGDSLQFGGETWMTLRFEPCVGSCAAMLIARKGRKGLTAFQTNQCLLIAVADGEINEDYLHNGSTMEVGKMADHLMTHQM